MIYPSVVVRRVICENIAENELIVNMRENKLMFELKLYLKTNKSDWFYWIKQFVLTDYFLKGKQKSIPCMRKTCKNVMLIYLCI